MQYNNTHGITQKKQTHTTQGYLPVYDNTYTNNYDYQPNSHKTASITNAQNGEIEQFKYDANGNISKHGNANGSSDFYWDESNRLRVIKQANNQMQHYIYDAAGERTLKASSQIETIYENGQIDAASTTMGLYTTYVSPYMVVDANQRYSKHYFNGTERIVSQMGHQDAGIFNTQNQPLAPTQNLQKGAETPTNQTSSTTTTDWEALKNLQIADLNFYVLQNTNTAKAKKLKVTFAAYKPEPKTDTQRGGDPSSQIPEMYYYHSDHLGTGTFLTDFDGNPYQMLCIHRNQKKKKKTMR